MDSQSRLLQILEYLYDHTDADHDISSKDIIQMLESRDSEAPDRRTIESDVDALISSGHDIQKTHRQGVPTRYKVIERDFDTVELKILIDAVAASRFINLERSKHIIERLASLTSLYSRDGLLYDADSLLSIKKAVGRNMYVADDLYRAIVRASIGPTFYGWLFQYAGKMTLAGPQEAVDDYNKHRKKATKGPKDNRCK